ncbi:FKBP-type peptidyl-prolyl cis-trans isomerase [Pontibacter sp. SGAir0037]|uniref:FKBP-type peptidyl-prolyl cis-trans isomerase n=1 Tax=Pontibacter sp. SGAir0037 TaxID=2571030 RepID=UPI0010CD1168|nr:FKBP-type peptidyl-prolyl cis-trans isomerase [Pontibacter sp. SGAir0037]QCR23659.1 peptidylprolyl isomerase [Pontibacter sp. SGAir0037]
MLSKTKFILPVLAGAALLFQSCKSTNNDEFLTTDTGLSYKIFEQKDGGEYENKGKVNPADSTGARLGQVVTMHMSYKNAEDSVLFDSRAQEPKMPIMIPVMASTFKGSLEEGLTLLSAGDSAVFKINADSLFTKTFRQPMPPFIKSGTFLTFYIKALKVQSEEEAIADMQREQQERAAKQVSIDDEKIQSYFKENNLQGFQKTESGLYYKITQQGKGAQPTAGDEVSVHYKLTHLDGKELESSYENPMTGGEPFSFPLGQGRVIPGWDEGIALLNKGSKATLLVPSTLAYGPQDRGPDMPANSVLRFDVELVDVKKQ